MRSIACFDVNAGASQHLFAEDVDDLVRANA
jgi:hypothetical protein